ncbi:MAG: (p)ppGpp synthetase [Eubacteriales bacterium]|nr:(p)ppGpp synthetase [Eubacteriales bacterium]
MTEEEYQQLVRPYSDASEILMSRLNVMKHQLYDSSAGKPIHTLQARIKSKDSIERKLAVKKNVEETAENARDYLLDIAGIRVICYFEDDIYNLVDSLKRQSDIIILKERNYIKEPKVNGYRSFHLILGIPVYYTDAMEYFPVEVQFRTLSMDFWASMEHHVLYKKENDNRENIAAELKIYADELSEMEKRFAHFANKIPVS